MNEHGAKIIVILLIIWILCFTVLSICFNSLLLRIYFIKTPSLTVQTLEDIVANPGLSVAGSIGLKPVKKFNPEVYHSLEKRVKEYEQLLDIHEVKELAKPELIMDVVERKAVVILGSYSTKIIQLFYPESNLKESNQKFNQLFKYSFVSKRYSKHKQMYRL